MSYKLDLLCQATTDPDGIGMVLLMLETARVPERHRNIFLGMPEGSVCIDCGANIGAISDIILKLGGICHAFEPSKAAIGLLARKYKDARGMHLIPAVVSNRNGECEFYTSAQNPFSQGSGTLGRKGYPGKYKVKCVRLVEYMRNLGDIYLLKIDVEGAEFDILDDIIKSGAYKNVRHIVCETHTRLYPELKPRLKQIRQDIRKRNIGNIHLDWI